MLLNRLSDTELNEKKLSNEQKVTLMLMLGISVIVFCLLIPVNRTGAENPDMLAVFEVDEFAQYEHALRMVTPGDTVVQTLRNFFIYLHYFYGFPFYALSGVSLLALKPFVALTVENTRTIVCFLRMTVSVVPMLLALLLLVATVTGLRRRALSVGLFVFLVSVPAVLINDFWWHPDSISFLWVICVIFCLKRDDGRFGWYYYIAAAFTGVAVGTKYQGLFFALTVPLLLLDGLWWKRLTIRAALGHAIGFVLVMALFVIVSNPLLLLPMERAEILRIQAKQFGETGVGTLTRNASSMFSGWNLNEPLRVHFADTWFWILTLGGWMVALVRRDDGGARRTALIVLSYLVVAFAVVGFSPTQRLHYFLPLVLPLFAGIVYLIPDVWRDNSEDRGVRWVSSILCALWFVQGCANWVTDAHLIRTQLVREAESPVIRFYDGLAETLREAKAETAAENRVLRVLRDAKAYFPRQDGVDVRVEWDMLTLETVTEYAPDWILVERVNADTFGAEAILDRAIDRDVLSPIQSFYAAVASDALPGYRTEQADRAAILLVREDGVER